MILKSCGLNLTAQHLWMLFFGWLASIASTFLLIFWHDATPSSRIVEGQPLSSVANRQSAHAALLTLQLDPDRLTLIMFLRPECACTPASLRALKKLVDECADSFELRVMVANYGEAKGLESTNAKLAARIPEAKLQLDPEGKMAELLNAHVSGTICIVSPQYQLLYLGRLTNSRGCDAVGPHYQIVKQIIQQRWSTAVTTPVFGCNL